MTIDHSQFRKFAQLSPFAQKKELIALVTDNSSKLMLNAGRDNPNWIVMEPLAAFFLLGTFGLWKISGLVRPLNLDLGQQAL